MYPENRSDYINAAMKKAVLEKLEDSSGFVAKIPGFSGLLVYGASKSEAVTELREALVGWINVSMEEGMDLPILKKKSEKMIIHQH